MEIGKSTRLTLRSIFYSPFSGFIFRRKNWRSNGELDIGKWTILPLRSIFYCSSVKGRATARMPVRLFGVKVGPELIFRNETRGLPNDSSQRSCVHFPMSGDGQRLLASGWSCTAKLNMVATLGMYDETKSSEDSDHFIARQPFQLRHERVQVPS